MAKTLSNLIPVLERTGYLQNYLTFGEGNQRAWDWQKTSKTLAGASKILWEAFLLGQPVDLKTLTRSVPSELIDRCHQLDLCRLRDGTVEFGGNRLLACFRHWFFCDREIPSRSYFGEDSRALMALVPALKQGRALCLNAETGVELPVLGAATGVDLVIQTSKRSSRYVQANLELNAASPATRLVVGSAVPEESFDLIAGRFPAFVQPEGLRLPESVAGGEDGMGRLREAIELTGKRLSKEGSFAFVGLLYGGEDSGDVADRFKKLCVSNGLSGGLTLTSKLAMEMGVPVLNQTISHLESGTKLSRQEIYERTIAHLKAKGLTHVYMAKGLAWRVRRGRPGFTHDLSPHYYGTWST